MIRVIVKVQSVYNPQNNDKDCCAVVVAEVTALDTIQFRWSFMIEMNILN